MRQRNDFNRQKYTEKENTGIPQRARKMSPGGRAAAQPAGKSELNQGRKGKDYYRIILRPKGILNCSAT
jgi:hypothetical protein